MFERCYVVSLARRPDRWARFLRQLPADWPLAKPEPFAAIDGQLVPHPAWWRQGKGAWGCYRSHLAIIELRANDNCESILILEDDALPQPEFARRAGEFFAALPDDWQMIYLGGQLIRLQHGKPRPAMRALLRPNNVHRTHAYGLRGRPCSSWSISICTNGAPGRIAITSITISACCMKAAS